MRAIKKILILRFRRVGDAVISTVLCSSLKKTFPEAEIHYVLNQSIAPLFENHPDIDTIISFNEMEMKDLSVYLRKVKEIVETGKYDIIVDLRSTVKTLWFSLFSLKTPYRIGKSKYYNHFLHNYRVDNRFRGIGDEAEMTLQLLKPLETDYSVEYDRYFRLYVTEEEKSEFRHFMQKQGIDFSKPVIVCAVTARLQHKVWKMERMKEILSRIIEGYDAQLIFNFGGREEQFVVDQLFKEMKNDSHIFINIEAKNLRELAAMFANSDFFFGNEGGPRHISQAFDIPSFAIYPPKTSKKKWLPNASNRFQGIEPADVSDKANDPDYTFMEKFDLITVDAVWKRLETMLDQFIKNKK